MASVAIRAVALVAWLAAGTCFGVDLPKQYDEARAIWDRTKTRAEYQRYAEEFVQFNNHFRLDEKDGCYARGPGQVNLLLVIVHPSGSEFAIIQRVLSDVDNAKARCFRKSYEGVRTKVPPFLPLVLQMGMQ